jgi:hypothetical protein
MHFEYHKPVSIEIWTCFHDISDWEWPQEKDAEEVTKSLDSLYMKYIRQKLFCTNHLQILHRLSKSRHFLNTYGYKLKNFQSDFSLPRVLWKRLFVCGCHNIKSHCTSVDLGPLGAQSCEFHSFSLLHKNSV